MKNFFFVFFIVLLKFQAGFSQMKLGNNASVLNNGQLLELEASGDRAGLKLAVVTLSSLTDRTTVSIPANAIGTMVYCDGASAVEAGTYIWNGNNWVKQQSAEFGDVKTGIQASDHNGWILLNGRPKSSLSITQQQRATALGIGVNLPDATNSYLTQNGSALGSVSGSNTRIIEQNQLPNVTLTGTTSGAIAGGITHGISGNPSNGQYGLMQRSTGPYTAPGTDVTPGEPNVVNNMQNHYHTFTTSSLNGNVNQQLLDITPRSLSVNMFIYLGF